MTIPSSVIAWMAFRRTNDVPSKPQTMAQCCFNVGSSRATRPSNNPTQFADGSIREPPGQWPSILLSVDPLLFHCWPSVEDAGPTVEQQWACNSLQRWYNIKPAVGEHPGLQVITNAVLRVGRDWIIATLGERRVRILRSGTGHDQLLMRWPN